MPKISRRLSEMSDLPAVLNEIGQRLRYHTESGLTPEEATGYADQLDDIQEILLPAWLERLHGRSCEIRVDSDPSLGGFLRIRVAPEGAEPVEVFTESYARFNAEMCDGSCHQYVYQRVLCYQDALATGRVAL